MTPDCGINQYRRWANRQSEPGAGAETNELTNERTSVILLYGAERLTARDTKQSIDIHGQLGYNVNIATGSANLGKTNKRRARLAAIQLNTYRSATYGIFIAWFRATIPYPDRVASYR